VLYLHAIAQLPAGKADAYLRAMHTHLLPEAQQAGLRLVGAWRSVPTTGRADEVLALWELDGWEHYARLQRDGNPIECWAPPPDASPLAREGRVLIPSPRCPTLAQLLERGVRGQVLLHERITPCSGQSQAYLKSSEEGWLPLAAERGYQWVGSYRVAIKGSHVFELWLLKDWEALARAMDTQAGNKAVQAWMESVKAYRADWDDCLFTPATFCPLG